jgi:HK97 family phage major capsid protein
MMSLVELKERRSSRVDSIRALVAKAEAEKRDLTDPEQKAFDAGKAEIERLEYDIRNGEFLAECERRMQGEPIGNADQQFDMACREVSLLNVIRSQCGMSGDFGREQEISQELERRMGRRAEGMLCPMSIFQKVETRAPITTGLPAAGPGGTLVATDFRPDQMIDILRDNTVVRAFGARWLDGLVGNVDIPRLKNSATAAWIAENAGITESDMQFEKISLTPKHCGALIQMSRNMVQQTTPSLEDLARNDMAQFLARAVDKVAIQGGGSNEPSGILVNANCTDVTGGTGNGGAITWDNVIACVSSVETSSALAGSLGFITNGKVAKKAATTLKTTGDTSSNFIIPDLGSNSLAGFPLARSNLVPSNLSKGTGSNLSALIFGNWSDLLIGVWSGLDILANPFDSTAFPKGNVLVRAMMTLDVALRQPKSFAFLDDIITT